MNINMIRYVLKSYLNYYIVYSNDHIQVIRISEELENVIYRFINKNNDFWSMTSSTTYESVHVYKDFIPKTYTYGGAKLTGILDSESRIFLSVDKHSCSNPMIIYYQDDAVLPQRDYTDDNLKYLNNI